MKLKSLLLLSFLFTSFFAYAQSYRNLKDASDFNLFVIHNANLKNADAQGKIAVGGNATLTGGFSVGDQLSSSSQLNVLIVGDTLRYSNGVVYNGNVVYGDTAFVSSLSIPDGSLIKGSPIDFSKISLQLADISRQWKLLPANGSVNFNSGKLTLSGANDSLNVFWIKPEDLISSNDMEIITPAGSTVLVNVSGDSLSWQGNLSLTGTDQTKVIFNFFEASYLNISGIEIKGSLLAPFASVNFNSGVAYGNFVAYDITGGGQFNNSLFSGAVKYSHSKIISDCEVTIKKVLTGMILKIKPSFLGHSRLWAGTFLGYANGHSTTFYCVDLNHWLKFNKDYKFDKVISGSVNFIVNNYYPNVAFTGKNGQLKNKREEAAAVQTAIWHFSDGFNPANITSNDRVKNRALEIIAEAETRFTSPPVTFTITPSSVLTMNNTSANFSVIARDAEGNPLSGILVELSSSGGKISIEKGFTDSTGVLSFSVQQSSGEKSVEIQATTYSAILPPAARYKLSNAQTLITNKPLVTCLTASAKAIWTKKPLPGSAFSFYSYDNTNSGIPDNYINDVAFNGGKVYVATHSAGYAIFNLKDETWQVFDSSSVNYLNTNNITQIDFLPFNGHKSDFVFAGKNSGFVYYNAASKKFKVFTNAATNGKFTGNDVNDFSFVKHSGKYYLLVAHDNGLSFFNISTGEFTNYNLTNSNFPGGNCRTVLVDSHNNIWAGTDYGLAVTKDFGKSWKVYTSKNTIMTGNIITALAANNDYLFVGTWNSGLYKFSFYDTTWTNLSAFVSAQPITALLYEDGKFLIGNYDHGLYVFDGKNFSQYFSVRPDGSPGIVNSVKYDGKDLWIATQRGLSRTTNGIKASTGLAKILLEDKTVPAGGTVTIACKLKPEEAIKFYRLSGSIVFNTNELKLVDSYYGKLFSGWRVVFDTTKAGRITFRAITNRKPIKKEGNLFFISFEVNDSLQSGLSAVYVTSFKAGINNELDHSDLGILTVTREGTANAGKGDVSLDGKVDISDVLKLDHYLAKKKKEKIKEKAKENADVDENGKIEDEDESELLSYLHNGTFPKHESKKGKGHIESGQISVDEENHLEVPFSLSNAENVRTVTLNVQYDSSKIDYSTFSSLQLENGNIVKALKNGKGKATFRFIAPASLKGSLDIGSLIFKPTSSNIEEAFLSTSYSINGGAEQQGPTVKLTMVKNHNLLPSGFKLSQNYPNPFNPTTVIRVWLPVRSFIQLNIYNILGQKVATLFKGIKNAGVHEFKWRASSFGSGIYFYRLAAGNFVQTKKMILLK